MERNSLSSSLRDHSIKDCCINTNKMMQLKEPLSQQKHCYGGGGGGEDYISGFSWPPRCYTCSFCKREFRSAQALGGHMNVHRRDRARLRQSPPPPLPLPSPPPPPLPMLNLNLNLNPNPNPNYFSTSLSPYSAALSSWVSYSSSISALSSPISSTHELKKWVVDHVDPSSADDESTTVRLNLEIGQVSDSKVDLDLELRLGYC